jgi:hypothetical protein
MRELGIDLSERQPQRLTRELAQPADVVVTMGCGDQCPYIPGKRYIDWDLPDPSGQPMELVRATRDEIGRRVIKLVGELDAGSKPYPEQGGDSVQMARRSPGLTLDAGVAHTLLRREWMSEVLQWIGAIAVLVAFGLSQWGVWSVASYRYLVSNCLGGAGLSAAAVISHQWGFVLLEGIWALVAARGIAVRLAGHEVRTPTA